ncbi:tetratricopeptide repeat protein [Pontiella agarivorans]|uniref:Tetratricopeptide repeat protein n=1 Tax=Pontiella agarivorans TaxID=3038953 RepID=A0ABU5N198_9BACT|nr:hypothetical protein [Pontiella agarivorans]MDZ8120215.1 hypothetical protein [Pontiella agarivorans]
MKRVFLSLVVLGAVAATAQQKQVEGPAGTPALLETANGKKAKVTLQKMEAGNLTFVAGSRSMTVPGDKISSLTFSMGKEDFDFYREQQVISDEQVSEVFKQEHISTADKLDLIFKMVLKNIEQSYNDGDFQKVIDATSSVMEKYIQYMPIKNNMRTPFVLTYNSYKSLGDYANATRYAEILAAMDNDEMKLMGQVGLAQIALDQGNVSAAEKIKGELPEDAVAADLYLKAAIQRAKGEQKDAIITVTQIIEEFPNDVEILPASELLVAYCYLDMTGTNSVISTNSAMNTARQVKNMYAGTAVAVNAEKLWAELGGREIEAEEQALKAEMEAAKVAAEEAAKKRKAEQKARREAEKAAKKADAANTDVSETTDN